MAESEVEKEKQESEEAETKEAQAAEEKPVTTEEKPTTMPSSDGQKVGLKAKLRHFFKAYWAKKKWTIPVSVLVLLLLILAIPFTRYSSLGLFLKKPVTITVVDSKTHTPVSSAQVTLAGKTFTTNGSGKATQQLKLGGSTLAVTKQYYQQASKHVTVALSGNNFKISLVATGRLVPVVVINKITGKPLANATIQVLHTEAKTDKNGKAIIVLPVGASTQKGSVSLGGYNTVTASVQVTDQAVAANTFSLTPAGKLYFLSNQSGKIDVVKTNLDGSDRQTVLAGTGHEDPNGTSLLASRDWKYLALLADRDGKNADVYLIDTTKGDKLINIDQGDAYFSLIGWSNDRFVYQVTRNAVPVWQPNGEALKSFDATNDKLSVLDQTQGLGSDQGNFATQSYAFAYLFSDQVVYGKNWRGEGLDGSGATDWDHASTRGKQAEVDSINTDGSNHKVIKTFPRSSEPGTVVPVYLTLQGIPYEADGLYISFSDDILPAAYYKYEDGKITSDPSLSSDKFYGTTYPTYLQSPSDKQSFWSDQRDGKNALFIGDSDAQNQKQIAQLSEYSPYGWYTDNYLLVSKNSSELYIMPASGTPAPQKITDYYKPSITYRGYGGGYGGL